MPEPHASTAAGTVIALGTVSVTGSVLGMQVDALVISFVCAALSVLVIEPQGGTLRAALWVALAMMLGSLLSPALASAAAHYFPWLNTGDVGRQASAALIALATPTVLPLIRTRARRDIAGAEEG